MGGRFESWLEARSL